MVGVASGHAQQHGYSGMQCNVCPNILSVTKPLQEELAAYTLYESDNTQGADGEACVPAPGLQQHIAFDFEGQSCHDCCKASCLLAVAGHAACFWMKIQLVLTAVPAVVAPTFCHNLVPTRMLYEVHYYLPWFCAV